MPQSIVFKQIAWAALLVLLFLPSNGCNGKTTARADASAGQPAANPEPSNRDSAENGRSAHSPVVIPSGRALSVRLLESINSGTARTGQRFAAELATPVTVNGQTILSRGAALRGRVVSVRHSGRLHKPGYLRLTLSAVQAPDGRWIELKTTSISATGKSHKKRNLTLIGGGTGVGAVIGAIAGGGKGAAIGAASGAGAGTVGAYATGKKDVTFPAEHRLSFSTVREVAIG